MGKEGKHVNVWRSNNKSISTPHLIEIWKQEDKRKWQAFSTDHRLLVGSCFCQQAEHWSVNSSPRTEQQVIVSDFQCFVWCFLQIFGWTLLYCIIWSKLAIAMIICLSVSLAVWYSFFLLLFLVCVCVCEKALMVQQRLTCRVQAPRPFARPSRPALISALFPFNYYYYVYDQEWSQSWLQMLSSCKHYFSYSTSYFAQKNIVLLTTCWCSLFTKKIIIIKWSRWRQNVQ
jgi:hypothetical protein